jgi:hypothetical protein
MKYDDDKVEALLKAVQHIAACFEAAHHASHINQDYPSAVSLFFRRYHEVRDDLLQCKPQPETEYVIPEWDEFSEKRATVKLGRPGHHVAVDGVAVCDIQYNAIREATRRPKRDLVPAGKFWLGSDIYELHDKCFAGRGIEVGLREFIDAIKAKCGV